jgi:hypothetical protein
MPKIINHSVTLLRGMNASGDNCPVRDVESAARTCYQSDVLPNAQPEERKEFVRKLIRRGHTAMIEFAEVGFRITTDRGVSHELVRHRIASWAQESTRYCNYGGAELIAGHVFADAVATLPETAPDIPRSTRVSVKFWHRDMPHHEGVFTASPPYRGFDGRFYVWVMTYAAGFIAVPVEDVTVVQRKRP